MKGHVRRRGHTLESIRRRVEPSTPSRVRGYERIIRCDIDPSIGRVSLAKLRIDQLDRLYSKLRDEGGQDRGPLSPAMVRQAHAVIEELSCFRGVEEARAAIVRTDVPRDCGWSSKRGLLGSIAGDCSPVVSNVAAP